MQINLSGHHVEVTSSLREYVDNKFSKLERHFDHINNVHVVLTVEKLNQKAEANVHMNGSEVFASAVCFAKESGKYDIKGHERMDCKGGIPAKEALGYINNADPSAIEVLLHIIDDKDSATAENRKVMLADNSQIGISIQNYVSFKKLLLLTLNNKNINPLE